MTLDKAGAILIRRDAKGNIIQPTTGASVAEAELKRQEAELSMQKRLAEQPNELSDHMEDVVPALKKKK